MPILTITGELVPRRDIKQKQSNKRSQKKKHAASLNKKQKITEEQAKYILDTRIALDLRRMF